MAFEWDPEKAAANFIKHGARLEEAKAVLDDPFAITIEDNESELHEMRFVSIGMGRSGECG